jgi:hypothetical protein
MNRRIGRARIALVTGLVVLGLTAFAGSAAASPGTTPTGHTGSCNMLAAYGAGDRGGIVNAWSQADANGVAGMFWAAEVTGTPLCVE